jgi:hypothetical protein
MHIDFVYVRGINKMHTIFINDLIRYIVFDMFRTTKYSSSGRLYKQLYSILSCLYLDCTSSFTVFYHESICTVYLYNLYRCMIKYRKLLV